MILIQKNQKRKFKPANQEERGLKHIKLQFEYYTCFSLHFLKKKNEMPELNISNSTTYMCIHTNIKRHTAFLHEAAALNPFITAIHTFIIYMTKPNKRINGYNPYSWHSFRKPHKKFFFWLFNIYPILSLQQLSGVNSIQR